MIVADMSAWTKVGEDLLRLDPRRFAAILEVAQRIANILEDPIGMIAAATLALHSDGDTH